MDFAPLLGKAAGNSAEARHDRLTVGRAVFDD